jgi:hypothetical protein
MATKGYSGAGTVLSIGGVTDGSTTETFTEILQVKTPNFSGAEATYDKITNLSSPKSGKAVVDELMPTTISSGTLELEGIYLPTDAGQAALNTAFATQDAYDFKVTLPVGPGQSTTGNVYSFSAYVKSPLLPIISVDKATTFKTTLQITGIITLTLGA